MPALSAVPTSQVLTTQLQKRLKALGGGRDIDAAIRINKHSYWWFLEYGTGSRALSTPPVPGTRRPAGIKHGRPGGGSYMIHVRQGGWYTNDDGERTQRRFLKLKPSASGPGGFAYGVRPSGVLHPGVFPANEGRGFIRVSVHEFRLRLKERLSKMRVDRVSRQEVVNVVNAELLLMLDNITARVPVGDDDDKIESGYKAPRSVGHLIDAISVTKAR